MRLGKVELFRFELPLARPLTSDDNAGGVRRGLFIRVESSTGESGWGEISPLPGLSGETVEDALEQARGLVFRLNGVAVPENLEELSGGFEGWLGDLGLAPSVRFGTETAVLNLLAGRQDVSLSAAMCDQPGKRVKVNALLHGSPRDVIQRARELQGRGYGSFKVKVGRSSIENDVALVRLLRDTLGDDSELRMDANRAWSADEAFAFASEVADCGVAYLEEPFSDPADLLRSLGGNPFPVALALDETLGEIAPSALRDYSAAFAAVIKPTALGLERSMMFARVAISEGLAPVVSSCFETGLGMTALLHLAACVQSEGSAAGLDTASWLAEDTLAKVPVVEGGAVDVANLPTVDSVLRRDILEPVNDA